MKNGVACHVEKSVADAWNSIEINFVKPISQRTKYRSWELFATGQNDAERRCVFQKVKYVSPEFGGDAKVFEA